MFHQCKTWLKWKIKDGPGSRFNVFDEHDKKHNDKLLIKCFEKDVLFEASFIWTSYPDVLAMIYNDLYVEKKFTKLKQQIK